MSDPKVLVFDIETAPIVAYVWGRKDVNIATNQIKSDSHVIAWSAKWLGAPASSIVYRDMRGAKPGDDRALLLPLWKRLDQADVVITQNGQSFDSPKLNARFILHGMRPPSPYRHLDTYRIARRVAKFTSNRLDYLTEKLCTKYKKVSHKKFPGMLLWTECLAGNVAAWDEMKHYNIQDVLATEELYNKLKAWIPQSMASIAGDVAKCRVCKTATKMWHKGYEYKKAGKFYRYQCQECFAWTTGGKV